MGNKSFDKLCGAKSCRACGKNCAGIVSKAIDYATQGSYAYYPKLKFMNKTYVLATEDEEEYW